VDTGWSGWSLKLYSRGEKEGHGHKCRTALSATTVHEYHRSRAADVVAIAGGEEET
jgi:hypothetical protein